MPGEPNDPVVLVVLTPEQHADILGLLALRDASMRGTREAVCGGLAVVEPWHVMGMREDGRPVGRGTGPIGGCGDIRRCCNE
jgi:hypothetical protein